MIRSRYKSEVNYKNSRKQAERDELKNQMIRGYILVRLRNLKDFSELTMNIIDDIELKHPGSTNELKTYLLTETEYSEAMIDSMVQNSNQANWPEFFKKKIERKEKGFFKKHNIKLSKLYHFYENNSEKKFSSCFCVRQSSQLRIYLAIRARTDDLKNNFIFWTLLPMDEKQK